MVKKIVLNNLDKQILKSREVESIYSYGYIKEGD